MAVRKSRQPTGSMAGIIGSYGRLKAFNCQLNYEEFQNHVADLEASIHATDNKIQQTRLAIQNQQVIQKHCEVYRACRDIIRAQNLVFTNFRRLKNCSDNRWNC